MSTMKKNLLIALATLSLGAALAPAQAQTAEGRHSHAARQEAMQGRMDAMRAKHAERSAERMAKLHDTLKLTAAQEPAWTAYVAAMKPAAGAHPTVDRAAIAAMSAPERMEKHIAMAKTRIATMEAHLAALKTFYAVLTAEQKKTFDQNVMHGAHGQRMMQHMMMKKQ
jgi:protein CpxP